MTRKNPSPAAPLPLSEVRSGLSPLLRTLADSGGAVGITVHGELAGYLVAAERFEAYDPGPVQATPRPLKGSLKLVGDLEKGLAKARAEVDPSLARTAKGLLR